MAATGLFSFGKRWKRMKREWRGNEEGREETSSSLHVLFYPNLKKEENEKRYDVLIKIN